MFFHCLDLQVHCNWETACKKTSYHSLAVLVNSCTLSCLVPVEIFPRPFGWSQWPPALYNRTKWLALLGRSFPSQSSSSSHLGPLCILQRYSSTSSLRLLALLNFCLPVLTECFLVNSTLSFSPSHSIPQVVSHPFNCRFFIFWSHQKSLLKLFLSYAISLQHLFSLTCCRTLVCPCSILKASSPMFQMKLDTTFVFLPTRTDSKTWSTSLLNHSLSSLDAGYHTTNFFLNSPPSMTCTCFLAGFSLFLLQVISYILVATRFLKPLLCPWRLLSTVGWYLTLALHRLISLPYALLGRKQPILFLGIFRPQLPLQTFHHLQTLVVSLFWTLPWSIDHPLSIVAFPVGYSSSPTLARHWG